MVRSLADRTFQLRLKESPVEKATGSFLAGSVSKVVRIAALKLKSKQWSRGLERENTIAMRDRQENRDDETVVFTPEGYVKSVRIFEKSMHRQLDRTFSDGHDPGRRHRHDSLISDHAYLNLAIEKQTRKTGHKRVARKNFLERHVPAWQVIHGYVMATIILCIPSWMKRAHLG